MKSPRQCVPSPLCILLYLVAVVMIAGGAICFSLDKEMGGQPWQIFLMLMLSVFPGILLLAVVAILDTLQRIARHSGGLVNAAGAAVSAAVDQPGTDAQPDTAPAPSKYFYRIDGEIFGPFTHEELLSLKATGEVNDTTLVQNEEEDVWVELGSLSTPA